MSVYLRLVVALVLVATMGAADGEVSAQTVGQPRPQGLFGGARTVQAPESLDLMVSVIEGWDRDIPAALLSQIDRNSLQTGGFSTILNASAQYASRGPRNHIAVNGSSVIRHYARTGATQALGQSAGVGASMSMPGRLTLMANQSASYSPTYFYGLFPSLGEIGPGDSGGTLSDFAVSDGLESVNYVSTVTMRHEQGRRRAFTVGGDYRYTDRLNETPAWQDTSFYSLRANYSFSVSRNNNILAGVRYRNGDVGYTGLGGTTEAGVHAGWSYTRPLSPTRSVALSVGLGATGADLQTVEGGVNILQRRYRATGDFRLSFPVVSTWQVTADFRRGFDYIPDLATPVFTTGARVGTSGLINRRIDVSAMAGYARGGSALNVNSYQFDTYSGTVRVRYAINQTFATYGEYLYYYYDFRGNVPLLLVGIPTGLERSGVRAGLTMWVPALRR